MVRLTLLSLLFAVALPAPWIALDADDLPEVSGLAHSREPATALWAHNDSGNAATLFRLSFSGAIQARYRLAPRMRDWEDIAAYRHGAVAALLLADVGDNFAVRSYVNLFAVSEPGGGEDRPRHLWHASFRYEDGPRDCEAVAVDEGAREILLISKRDDPPRLYALPLPETTPDEILVARRVGVLPQLRAPREARALPDVLLRRERNMPTAFDLSADGRSAVVITYGDAYVYRRKGAVPWREVLLNTPPQRITLPAAKGIEAGALAPDGTTLFLAHEGWPPGFTRLALPPP